jgi:NADPH:quinone reductase-like Zn-dependent oxidoreductase
VRSQPGVAQASIHNWAKNGTTVTVLGGFVNRGELKPTVQEYFPLADVMRAVNVSRGGQVIGKLGIVVKG